MASTLDQRNDGRSFLATSVGIVGREQTYRNLLYLVLAFPLGLFYFTALTSGLALGVGLIVTLVGIPLLLAVVVGSRYVVSFERRLANALLDLDLPAQAPFPETNEGLWPRVKSVLTARSTWLGLLFLYARFVLGLASFVLVTVSLALTVALVTAPFHYTDPTVGLSIGSIQIDTLDEALLAVPLGLLVGLLSLHLFNAAAWISGKIAVAFLDE